MCCKWQDDIREHGRTPVGAAWESYGQVSSYRLSLATCYNHVTAEQKACCKADAECNLLDSAYQGVLVVASSSDKWAELCLLPWKHWIHQCRSDSMQIKTKFCRVASVLITAHKEDLTDTIMTASEEVMPDVGYDVQAESTGVISKGYQQITSWQVCTYLSTDRCLSEPVRLALQSETLVSFTCSTINQILPVCWFLDFFLLTNNFQQPDDHMERKYCLLQVYDISLSAALREQKCGPSKLLVDGNWKWLLEAFAKSYGICKSYTCLAHLRWVMRWAETT